MNATFSVYRTSLEQVKGQPNKLKETLMQMKQRLRTIQSIISPLLSCGENTESKFTMNYCMAELDRLRRDNDKCEALSRLRIPRQMKLHGSSDAKGEEAG